MAYNVPSLCLQVFWEATAFSVIIYTEFVQCPFSSLPRPAQILGHCFFALPNFRVLERTPEGLSAFGIKRKFMYIPKVKLHRGPRSSFGLLPGICEMLTMGHWMGWTHVVPLLSEWLRGPFGVAAHQITAILDVLLFLFFLSVLQRTLRKSHQVKIFSSSWPSGVTAPVFSLHECVWQQWIQTVQKQ